jgi:hypothetical protein
MMRWTCALVLVAACGRFGFDDLGESAGADAGTGRTGTIAFDATSSATGTNVTRLDWTHAVAGADPGLFVVVSTRNSNAAPPAVAAITFGGVALTKVVSLCPTCGSNGVDNLELWVLAAPPSGTASVAIALTGSAAGASAVATSYRGVAQTGLVDVAASTAGTSISPSLSWTTQADDTWTIAAKMVQGAYVAALVPGSSQSERSKDLCDPHHWQGQSMADQATIAAAATVTFTWAIGAGESPNCTTDVSSHNWIAVGASFKGA